VNLSSVSGIRASSPPYLIVLALDLLSRIASRYGRCGKKVFEANQDPILSAMQLFECVPFADVDKILVEPLRAW
jgi:hypothetical protein